MSTHAPKPEPTYPLVQVSEAELDHAVDALRTLPRPTPWRTRSRSAP